MKRTKQILALVLSAIIMISAGGVAGPGIHADAKSSKKSITLNYSKYTLKKKKTLKLKATTAPKKAKVIWKSSKPKIATVDKNGKVKALKKGKVTITATIAGTKKKAKIRIIVGTPVKAVTLPETEKTLTIGEEYAMKPVIAPAKASDKVLEYKSSNEAVATVDTNGNVKAVAEGTADITVSSTDGSKKKAKLVVTVKKAEIKATSVSISYVEKTSTWGTVTDTISKDDSITLTGFAANDTVKFSAAILPAEASQEVEWSVEYVDAPDSTSTYVTIEDGVVTLKKAHYTMDNEIIKVTAKAKDGSGKSKTIKIQLNWEVS
jgi:translation initiation factor IF-1